MDWLNETVKRMVESGSPFAYGVVFLAGILTSFTPCVYPIIPIIAGYIGAQQVKSRFQAFLLSACYVVGMAITFSVLGAVAALTGSIFGKVQSSPYAFLVVGNIILLMALWFLDIIHIPLPSFAAPRIVKKGYLTSFFLGLISGLIAVPCASAIVGTLLAYIAVSGAGVIFGTTLLFTYAIGIGILLMAVGTFTGFVNTLMKSEKLSQIIKKVFGIALFLIAEYFFIQAGQVWF